MNNNSLITILTAGLISAASGAQISITLEAPSNLGLAPGFAGRIQLASATG